jgi:hypothetical protein
MFVLETDTIPWEPVKANTRTGDISRKFIREGELSAGVGYTSDLVYYHRGEEPFTAPRHRHNFDQIRLTLGGVTDYGYDQVAGAGDVTFFPAGAYYGPEWFEEAEIFLLQWSPDWVTREQSDAAYAELSKHGTFVDGYYVTTDESGNEVRKDGTNAVWEKVNQKPLVIPSPKYSQPIVMHPGAYDWWPEAVGVESKDLGHFTEGDLTISPRRWEQGGSFTLGADRTSILWVASGSVSIDDRKLGARTILFSEIGETHQIVGVEPGEATVVGLPKPV